MPYSFTDRDFTASPFRNSHLLRRCVSCPSEIPPCPLCAGGEICTEFPGSCQSCPTLQCLGANSETSETPTPSSSSSGDSDTTQRTITIVASLLGGLLGLAILSGAFYLLTRKHRKNRKVLRQRERERERKNKIRNINDRTDDMMAGGRHELDSQPIESPPSEPHSDAIVVFLEGKEPQRGLYG